MENNNINTKPQSFASGLRKIFCPIESYELKKFLPMALMMACILFNYSMFRSVKDGLVVTEVGSEAISFVKLYIVLPSAILFMIIYTKLCNKFSYNQVFYIVLSVFIGFFALFTFMFYPNPDFFHPNPAIIEDLASRYVKLQWFIKLFGKWTYVLFYTFSELWGSVVLSLLFWGFANKITKTNEAKRFYSMFGMLGNIALIFVGLLADVLLDENFKMFPEAIKLTPLLACALISGVIIMILFRWINNNVLTDPSLYDPDASSKKKKKAKLSLSESFKMIFSSKYLGLLVTLVIAYGISIILVEGVWKDKLRELYPNRNDYTKFMAQFQIYQGSVAILFMLIGSNILRRVSWMTAAIFTPVMIFITGVAFFSFIFFDSTLGMYVSGIIGIGPLVMVAWIGVIQNVLSKATKYSLFDSTKEMAYIPLDDEMKTKGKSAVDVVGGRLGKSGGGLIISTFFLLFQDYNFKQATPYFAGFFFVIVILWIFAVIGLSKEYNKAMLENQSSN
ncbi:MAG TPA: Npt1/Npt2 family nucleotide transporter [Candidatus Megaira endosymbiont of Hartmannula sinica]|nr:Npt1/Npt2 family nucleotide transporter [Candidatus Megaera endosymbiont of Hartmannula sinica]